MLCTFLLFAGRWAPLGCAIKMFILSTSTTYAYLSVVSYPWISVSLRDPSVNRVPRIIFTGNCYGAPWGNAAVLCDLLDGVRDKPLHETNRVADVRSAISRDLGSG